jgi:hypothetical protein
LLFAAECNPSEVMIDTIPCYDAQDALVRSCMPFDLFREEEDEGLSGCTGRGIEPGSGET